VIFEDPWTSGAIDDATQQAILHALGGVIRHSRKTRGIKLADLAEQCGVSQSVLCRIELARRYPSAALVVTACAALGVRPSDAWRAAENAAIPLPWQSDRYEPSVTTPVIELAAPGTVAASAIRSPSSLPVTTTVSPANTGVDSR
jgi:transcriptional regulator with XRE-family HTH domain